jgi:hypothetical protein
LPNDALIDLRLRYRALGLLFGLTDLDEVPDLRRERAPREEELPP